MRSPGWLRRRRPAWHPELDDDMRMGLLMVGVVVLVVGALGGACSSDGPERHVSLPSADAPPKEVVLTYLDALDAHDIATARQLLSPEHEATVEGSSDSWFDNVVSITHAKATDWPVSSDDYRYGYGYGYDEIAKVSTQYDVDVRDNASVPDGPWVWDYYLGRNAGGRWVIVDEGTG